MRRSPGSLQARGFTGRHASRWRVGLVVLLVLLPREVDAAGVGACIRAVARASATLARDRMRLRMRCNPPVTAVRGPLVCPDAAMARARARARKLVERHCGGANRRCDRTADDAMPAGIG